MKYYTIAVSDTFHAGLIDALRQMNIEDTGSTVLEDQERDSEDSRTGGSVSVHASSESLAQLQDIQGVVDDTIDLVTSMGADVASLQSMKHELDELSAAMADAEAFKDLSERLESIQRAYAEAEAVQAMRAELDAAAPKLDAAVRYLKDLKRAFICIGIGAGAVITFYVFRAFGDGLVAIIALLAFVAAASILTGWKFKDLFNYL
ncbi:unnamed protein product [Peniophora sp. CBMAI 1063]|nr:unnamed protein product [Peniophora sp. CBMAI 1063]